MGKVYNYKGYVCELVFKKYLNGQVALQLESVEDGLVSTATVAVDERIEEGYVAIKDYSENEGMLDFLIEEGIVEESEYILSYGYVNIPVCKLLIA